MSVNSNFVISRMKLVKIILLTLGLVSFDQVAAQSIAQAAVGCGPNTYKENPKIRKQKSQTALLKAMELNARVESMVKQGSDQFEAMVKMLSDSYGYQIAAIGQMEGVVRESCFKDPMIEREIKNMYVQGKPSTLEAEGRLRQGDSNVLELLDSAKLAHRKFLIVTY